jgi:predicted PurR-regulated permease PerM
MQKSFIISIIAIVAILAAAFLSQQAYTKALGNNLISAATNQVDAYATKGSAWVMSNVYPKITGEVQKRGAIIQNEVNQEKQKVSENIGQKIQNYFSGITNSILHPGQTNTCPTPAPTTTTN